MENSIVELLEETNSILNGISIGVYFILILLMVVIIAIIIMNK